MDRNILSVVAYSYYNRVALRKESVDRNIILPKQLDRPAPSLSARRAWIEILISARQICLVCVALRKESVDRNPENPMIRVDKVSLSARRAWIEILLSTT